MALDTATIRSDLTTQGFGIISSANHTPRSVQLSIHVIFSNLQALLSKGIQ